MSLINDALKRAKQAQAKNPPPPPATAPEGAPMRPVETKPRRGPAAPSSPLPLIIAAIFILIGVVVFLFAFKRQFPSDSGKPTIAQTPVPGSPQTVPTANSAPPASAPERPANATTPAATIPSAVSTIATSTPAVAVVPTVVTQTVVVVEKSAPVTNAVPPVLPKLQGILFNPARPTAFLNGKSYLIGGRVGEFTVVGITKEAVTVERAGQTNVLTMQE